MKLLTHAPWPVQFYRSQLGKKAVMAVTGIILFGFVFFHMLGNLKMFLGPEALNTYAEWLRDFGEPAAPRTAILWVMRLVLIGAVVLHIAPAVQLTLQNRRARPQRYERHTDYVVATYASRTMRWGGVIIALFVIWHLAQFTWGWVQPGFVRGDVYHNVMLGFRVPWVVAWYILAQIALGLHIKHGLWSIFQSLGFSNPKYNAARRWLAVAFAGVIAAGNIAMPVAVFFGVVK